METASVPVLTVSRLSKNYGRKTALRDFSYTFTPGIYGLLGPNGAGKTTTIKIMTGLLRAEEGSITIDGINALADLRKLKAMIGYVPDFFGIVLLLDGMLMMMLGLVGEYVGRMYMTMNKSPQYVIRATTAQAGRAEDDPQA